MKTNYFIFRLFIGISLTGMMVSCGDYGDYGDYGGGGGGGNDDGLVFLVGCSGSSDGAYTRGIYKMTLKNGGPGLELITSYYTWANGMNHVDMRNGRIAMSVDNPPEGGSCVAWMDADDLKNIRFVPTPPPAEGYYYTVTTAKPQVMSDGRIIYHVVAKRDVYEDHHVGQLAIYDPSDNSLELSGSVSDFVLSQPEQGGDTEAGSMASNYVLSKDEKYVYCQVYGYGTDWGTYHSDYHFIVRYKIGEFMSYSRIAQTGMQVKGITGDGNYLIVGSSGTGRINLSTNVVEEDVMGPGSLQMYAGHTYANSAKTITTYRGEGLALYNMSASETWMYYIVRQANMQHRYNGLGNNCFFSPDGSKVYFMGSTDYYTNYDTDVVLFSTPVMENNTQPDSLTNLPVNFCTGFFLLLSED